MIVALGHAGEIEKVIVDTLHFKGNYPDTCSIQGAFVKGGTDSQIETQSLFWRELLPAQKLEMDADTPSPSRSRHWARSPISA